MCDYVCFFEYSCVFDIDVIFDKDKVEYLIIVDIVV